MKNAALVIVSLSICTLASAQAVLRPLVGAQFGVPCKVTAEFIDKANDYYSQNVLSEPYQLRVVAVDGRTLGKPIIIEYRWDGSEAERTKIERKTGVITLEAFETVYQPPTATPWLASGEQGMPFTLIHVLHLRPDRSKP